MARKKQDVVELGRTRAYIAAMRLRSEASANRDLASKLIPAHVARNTIPNLQAQAEMFDEVAAALELLDRHGYSIVPEALVPTPEQEAAQAAEQREAEASGIADQGEAQIGLGEVDGSGQ